MRAEFITPFLDSLSKVIGIALPGELHVGTLSIESRRLYDVTATVGLSGKAIGTLVISLSESLAIHLAAKMLLVETDGLNDDVIDAVGEVAMQVASGAAQDLAEFEMTATLPCVVTGRQHRLRFPSDVRPLMARCETAWGPLLVEVALAAAPQLAHFAR
jgi:chemotaxis protein CheX